MVPPSADWLIVGFGVGEDEVAGLLVLAKRQPPNQPPAGPWLLRRSCATTPQWAA